METFSSVKSDQATESQARSGQIREGLTNGFAEAAQAFSDEVVGTSSYAQLAGGLLAGQLRANARILEELAAVTRKLTVDLVKSPGRTSLTGADMDKLADLVASRVGGAPSAGGSAPEIDYDRLADLVAERLGK